MFIFFLLIFPLFSVQAEELLLEPITVQSSRLSDERRSVQVITETDILNSNAIFLGDLLQRSAGVDWNSNGFAYIRGGTGAQTLVYIDGVRANDPSDPSRAFDFSSIDLTQVERVEILKGPQSVSFGSDALAGVISITTKKTGTTRKDFSLLYGSLNTVRGSALILTPIGEKLSLSLRASTQHRGGQSVAAVPTGDDDENHLHNVGAHLRYQFSTRGSLDLGGTASYLKQDLDLGSFSDDPNSRSRTLQKTGYLNWQQNLTGSSQTKAILSRKLNRRAYDDRAEPGNTFATLDSTYYSALTDLDLSHRIYFSSDQELVLGGEWKKEKLKIESQISPVRLSNGQIDTAGIYAQYRYHWGMGFTTDLGLRHERPSGFPSSTQKKIGLEKTLGKNLKLTSAFGTGFKLPALSSLYDPVYGNPTQKPEKSKSFEGGFEQTIADQNQIRLTGFTTHYKELISYNALTLKSENIAAAQIQGVELETKWLQSRKLSFQTHTTYLRAWDRQTQAPLPRRARWKGGVVMDYRLSDQTHFQGEGLIKSAVHDSATQTVRTPMFTFFNLSGNQRITKNFKLTLRIENLLDRQYYETLGYTTSGRSYFAGIEAQF